MNKRTLDEVVIIYNPHSTGDSEFNAKKLRDELKELSAKQKVTLLATKYPRHAEKIATDYARKKQRTLLISSSGDGGYHELINGIMASGSSNVVAGLLPSGNANDHFSAVGSQDVAKDIIASRSRYIDVLKVEATMNGRPWVRYAHSYVGIGISPVVGKELNKKKLNPLNEKVILLRQLAVFTHVSILLNGHKTRVTSLICANVNTMSKVLKISTKDNLNDGKFEVNLIKTKSTLHTIGRIIQATTLGLSEESSVASYSFDTINPTPIQLDGEIYRLDSHSKVTVSAVSDTLSVII